MASLFKSLGNLLKPSGGKTSGSGAGNAASSIGAGIATGAKHTVSDSDRTLPGIVGNINAGIGNIAGIKDSDRTLPGTIGETNQEVMRRMEEQRCAQLRVRVEEAYSALKRAEGLASQARDMKSRVQSMAALTEEAWKGDSGTKMKETLNTWVSVQENDVQSMEMKIQNLRKVIQNLVEADKSLADYMRSH